MIRRMLVLVGWVGVGMGLIAPQAGFAQEPGPDYVLVAKSARRIKAVLTFEVKGPNVLADEWSVYVSQIPELPGQVEVKTTLIPTGRPARELSDEGRAILFTKVPSLGQQWRKEIKTRVEYEATLLERRLELREADAPAAPVAPVLDPKTRRLFLSNDHQFDFQAPRFKAWLDANQLRRKPGDNEVDFARKAFLAVRHGFTYSEEAEVEHLASKVCEAGKSDDSGLIAVFVAALRANGIPTRILAGRTILSDGKPTRANGTRARTEFYVTGLGWIPADPSGAIRSGRKTEGLEYFGNDSGEFLTHHIDTDLIVDTYFGFKTHEWLQNPVWWVIGGGDFEGSTTRIEVTVESEPLDLAAVVARLNARPTSTSSSTTTTKKQATKTSKKKGN